MSMALSVLIMIGLVAYAFAYDDNYPNTYINTGNYVNDLIGVARTQIGYRELDPSTGNPVATNGPAGYTKYGDSFGAPTGEWCAYFVSWCAREAEIPTSVMPQLGNCAAMVKWYETYSVFHTASSGYIPKAGDLVFINWEGGATAKHVGIITGVSGDRLYTIEGNTGVGRGYECMARTRSLSASYIVGYGVVDGIIDGCSILDIDCQKIPDQYDTYTVTVKGRPAMLKLSEYDGNTRIFNRYDALSITAYDAQGNEVNSMDRTADHEVWVVLTSPIENNIYMQLKFVSGDEFRWGIYSYRFIVNADDTTDQ